MSALTREKLSLGAARRIALAAQGLAKSRYTGTANWTRIARALGQMKVLQIDSVNVLVRSHYLPVFARAGNYAHEALDSRLFGRRDRRFFEYWGHQASFLPFELYPLMRWRMARAHRVSGAAGSLGRFARANKAYVRAVLDHVRMNGPTAVSDLPDPGGRSGNWWGWSKGKLALEYLFEAGEVTAATRRGFERLYDVPERVIPADILNTPQPSEKDAVLRLVELSSEALGIATMADLQDYFRLSIAQTSHAVAHLIEEKTLAPATVKGWKQQAFLHKDAAMPRKSSGRALLSPFDPLIWDRERAERLFDLRYRIEIYTPAPKRIYGYYVLPFLQGDRFTARVCLKADRQAGVLRANAAHLEDGAEAGETASALAAELSLMAQWLGLEGVEIGAAGDLSSELRRVLATG